MIKVKVVLVKSNGSFVIYNLYPSTSIGKQNIEHFKLSFEKRLTPYSSMKHGIA